MADETTGLLSVKEWLPAHPAEVTYSSATQEIPPALGSATVPNDIPDGKPQTWLLYRFARIEAHSGDLLYAIRKANDAAPTLGSGSFRVLTGTAEVVQLSPGMSIYLQGAVGPTTGAVIWGR